MNTISPKMAKLLTVAIVRKARKFYPGAGNVGVYGFNGNQYPKKSELRPAVLAYCETLTWEQVPLVKHNFGLV